MKAFTFAAEPFEVYPELDEFEVLDPEFNDKWQSEYSSQDADYISRTYAYPFGLQHQFESGFPGIEPESGFPNSILEALRKGLESVAVKLAVTFGYRDEITLTNIVFFARHPERSGRKLLKGEPGFENLSREWLDIRNLLVRPALKQLSQTPSQPPGVIDKPSGTLGVVNKLMPKSGPGFFCRMPKDRRYGQRETIQALIAIGAAWSKMPPTNPARPRIIISDISKPGGGKFPPHVSHQVGLDVDIRLMRNDGKEEDFTWCAQDKCNIKITPGKGSCTVEPGYQYHRSYSQPLTQELVNLIHGNGVLKVEFILFNDPKVKGVKCYKNHDNHLHVRFYPPGNSPSSNEVGQQSAASAPTLSGSEKASHGETIYLQIGLGMGKNLASTGIYVPNSFKPDSGVTVILYLHGHKGMYPGNATSIKGYWDGVRFPFFALREEVSASGQNVIFVAPPLGTKSEAGSLIKRGGFDAFMQQVLAGFNEHYLMPRHGRRISEVRSIILAAHSGGGSPMLRIATGQDQYAMKIKECWGFDSMYGLVAPNWITWAKSHPQKSLYAYYGPAKGQIDPTGKKRYLPRDNAEAIACEVRRQRLTNVCVQPSAAKSAGKVSAHFWVPQVHLKERLLNSPCQAGNICPKRRV